jgi:predicted nucleic acid-binding protein
VIVADTNLVSYLLMEGEQTPAAREVRQRDPQWVLPPLWRSEFLNVLATSCRAAVIDLEQALSAWHLALELFTLYEPEPQGVAVLETAVRDGLSAYDAQFVVVARQLGVPLVTSDRKILSACPDIAVAIEAFGLGNPTVD